MPYKRYEDAPTVALPGDYEDSMPALAALDRSVARGVADGPAEAGGTDPLDLRALGALLHYSAGVTKTKQYPGREIEFRAASCTGAMYHIELYVVTGDLPGLDAGVYHFDPEHNRLVELRRGDYRGQLAAAAGIMANAEAYIVYSDYFWRNAVKYQARAYRHTFWDTGTILANTLAMAAARGVAGKVLLGFVDAEVDELLGLDGEREASVALLSVGTHNAEPSDASASALAPGDTPDALPASARETVQSEIVRAHQSGNLADAEAVAAWREAAEDIDLRGVGVGGRPDPVEGPEPAEGQDPVEGPEPAEGPDPGERPDPEERPAIRTDASLESVISRRGSTRQFAHQSLPLSAFTRLLDLGSRRIPWDAGPVGDLNHSGLVHNRLYAVVNSVEGLASGAYRCDTMDRIHDVDRRMAAHLALGQRLGADASACLYWLSDLSTVVDTLGNRGYRAAQLEAAVMGGRVYLASYAMGFGATGLTFFDDAVTAVFGADDSAVMFLVAVGRSA